MPEPKKWDAVEHLRDAVTRGGISKAELARRSGVHVNSLVGLEGEAFNPRWKTLKALCAAADEIKAERA